MSEESFIRFEAPKDRSAWESFANSGKIEDYLKYREINSCMDENKQKTKEGREDCCRNTYF